MGEEQIVTFKTKLYSCEIAQSVTIIEVHFGISIPPGDMLAIADFILAHRARLEQQQRELDHLHEALVQEVKAYCSTHEKPFGMLSSWDITDLMRELAGTAGHIDEWEPVEHLSPAGRWYRTVCCDESGGICSHIWEPFYAVCQQWQQREEERGSSAGKLAICSTKRVTEKGGQHEHPERHEVSATHARKWRASSALQ